MNIIKSTGTFSFYTLISRILGYLRDFFIAIFLGSGPVADAFFVAFRIPNTFRRLFGEGSFNAAFVPSYSKELIKTKKKSEVFANDVFNLLALTLLILVIIVELFMPFFVSLIAPGFKTYPEKFKTPGIEARVKVLETSILMFSLNLKEGILENVDENILEIKTAHNNFVNKIKTHILKEKDYEKYK